LNTGQSAYGEVGQARPDLEYQLNWASLRAWKMVMIRTIYFGDYKE